MDPPELWPALNYIYNIIENLNTLPIKLQEPPDFGGSVVVFVTFRDARKSKGTPRDPWALNASKAEGASHNGSVASAMTEQCFKDTREH